MKQLLTAAPVKNGEGMLQQLGGRDGVTLEHEQGSASGGVGGGEAVCEVHS
jgi:hypothetical protein